MHISQPCQDCRGPKERGRQGSKYCVVCAASARHARNHRHAERTAYIQEIKLRAGCADCGYRDHPAALDFDHVRGVKVRSIGDMIARLATYQEIDAEIAKCEVVCSNCHRVRTARRRG